MDLTTKICNIFNISVLAGVTITLLHTRAMNR